MDHLRGNAFPEGKDLESRVEAIRDVMGFTRKWSGDTIYGARENRKAPRRCRHNAAKTTANASRSKAQQSGHGYRLNCIRASVLTPR